MSEVRSRAAQRLPGMGVGRPALNVPPTTPVVLPPPGWSCPAGWSCSDRRDGSPGRPGSDRCRLKPDRGQLKLDRCQPRRLLTRAWTASAASDGTGHERVEDDDSPVCPVPAPAAPVPRAEITLAGQEGGFVPIGGFRPAPTGILPVLLPVAHSTGCAIHTPRPLPVTHGTSLAPLTGERHEPSNASRAPRRGTDGKAPTPGNVNRARMAGAPHDRGPDGRTPMAGR
jgi:hypothetical protein